MKTISLDELSRLAFCNSLKLPSRVWLDGKLIEWTGIGWIELDASEAKGNEPTVIRSEEKKKPKKRKATK